MQVETTTTTSISTGQGLAYRIRPNLEIETAFRQLDLADKKRFVILTDVILNLGKIQ